MAHRWLGFALVLAAALAGPALEAQVRTDTANLTASDSAPLDPDQRRLLEGFAAIADRLAGTAGEIASHGGSGEAIDQLAKAAKNIAEGRDGEGQKLSRQVMRQMLEGPRLGQLEALKARMALAADRLEKLGTAIGIVDTGFKALGHLYEGDTSGMLITIADDAGKFLAVKVGAIGGTGAAGPIGAVIGAGLAEEAWKKSGHAGFERMAVVVATLELWDKWATPELKQRAALVPEFRQYIAGEITRLEFVSAMHRRQRLIAEALERLAKTNATMKQLVDAYTSGKATREQVLILEGALNQPMPGDVVAGDRLTPAPLSPADKEMLDAICRCSSSCAARGFYSTEPVKVSPSCAEPSNGPCVCAGMGCLRGSMSPACVATYYRDTRKQALDFNGVLNFLARYEANLPLSKSKANLPPLVRKGEALKVNIDVPGKSQETWLWRTTDGVSFDATRLSGGGGKATETVRLEKPSMGHLVFARDGGHAMLALREPMNGGFIGAVSDTAPNGAKIAAQVVPDPGPASGGVVFAVPAAVGTKGQWGTFAPAPAGMTLKGRKFERYFLQHPGSAGPTTASYLLDGRLTRFKATIGIDQSMNPRDPIRGGATVKVRIEGDGKELWASPLITLTSDPVNVDVDLRDVGSLSLIVEDGGDGIAYDWLVWADPVFE